MIFFLILNHVKSYKKLPSKKYLLQHEKAQTHLSAFSSKAIYFLEFFFYFSAKLPIYYAQYCMYIARLYL